LARSRPERLAVDESFREASMTVEEVAARLRQKLVEAYGAEEASWLMDRPPGGWTDLVTNQTLHLELDTVRAELRGEFAETRGALRTEMERLSSSVDRRLRNQTWISTTTLIGGLTLAFTAGRLF
jgi:hypothetical protein